MHRRHPAIILLALVAPMVLAVGIVVAPGCDRQQDGTPAPVLGPEHDGQLTRADALLGAGRTDDAYRVAAALVSEGPGDWRSHELMARVHMQQALALRTEGLMEESASSLARAADAYQASIATEPDVAGLFRSGADAAQMAGRVDVAVRWYERSIALDPTDPRTPLRLAQVVFESDPARARALLVGVLAMDDSIPEAHASIALLDAQEGDEQAARERMKRAVELATDVPAIRVVQARMLRLLGQPQRGAEILLALPPVDRSAEPTALELARCWAAVGRHAAAADAWDDCFRRNAYRTDAWRFVLFAAEASMRAGDEPRAAGLLEQAAYLSAPQQQVEAVRRMGQPE